MEEDFEDIQEQLWDALEAGDFDLANEILGDRDAAEYL